MAMIHVNRSGTTLGTFSEEDVRAGLRVGRFLPTDLGWREGMSQWQPLSQFTEFVADIPAADAAAAPGAPPGAAIPSSAPAIVPGAVSARTGLPWENRAARGLVNAFIDTLQMVLTKPDMAFGIMKTEGSLADPISYALIGGCLGAVVSFVFSIGLQSFGLFGDRHSTLALMAGLGAGSVIFLILVPIMVVIFLFLAAAIVHVCLMIVGGANKSFETTLRVIGFAQGATGPLQMIPICGAFIAGIWALVLYCIGLARAHETTTGRAVVAVFLPFFLCCGGAVFLSILVPTMFHMTSQH
jgi:hypothetical protein